MPKSDQSASRHQAAVNRARQLLGLPWVHQGRNPELGIDCAGLVIESGLAAGVPVVAPADYGRVVHPSVLIDSLRRYCNEVDKTDLQPGDVLLMAWRRVPQHLGVYIGNDFFIHAYEKQGVVEQQLIPFWRERIVSVYRII